MAGLNRASLISKTYKVLKQHYKPVLPSSDRPLLQQMLFACCLENAPYAKAEKVYDHLCNSFFDWNEVRVSTVKELAEAMRELPSPVAAAANLKAILQNVFEATYSFDLETVKKQNIGAGIKKLAKFEGASPFVVAYATQHALAGHSIPLDRGAIDILFIVGIAAEAERKSGNVAGLERAIPKNKGAEFGSLLHQFAADYIANPLSPHVKALLLSINPEAKARLPKRGQKKPLEAEEESALAAAQNKSDGKPTLAKGLADAAAKKGAVQKSAQEAAQRAEKGGAKKHGVKDANTTKPVGGDAAKKKQQHEKRPLLKPAGKTVHPARATSSRDSHSTRGKSATKHLAKRKPR